jgi:hypothetical protein
VLSLRDRARKLKISGRFILLAIVFSIASGIQVFYSADSSARSSNGEFQLKQLVYNFDRSIINRWSRPSNEEKITQARLDDFLREVKATVKVETDRFIESADSDPQAVIISTLTTRVGVIFLLIFLVKILVSMYRYSIKLASQYDGRADLLQCLPANEILDFEKLILLTTTENIDFSKQDKAPGDYAVDIAKKIIEKSVK